MIRCEPLNRTVYYVTVCICSASSVPNLVAHQRAQAGVKKSLKQMQQRDSWTLQVEAMQQLGRAAGSLDQHLLALVVRSLLHVRSPRPAIFLEGNCFLRNLLSFFSYLNVFLVCVV